MAGGENTVIFEMRRHDDPMQLLTMLELNTVYGAVYIFIDHVQRLAYRQTLVLMQQPVR